MTPHCGSTDPTHVSRRCKGCKAVYNKRWASRGPVLQRIYRNPAKCVFCGLQAGNSAGVKVLRYPLLRHIDTGGRHTSVCIGSMAMCDRCVVENGKLNGKVRINGTGALERDDGLRSYDGMPLERAS